ncbi:hypothetical protein FRB91_000499 [Serendipita sp. 411]|nr:hypothetical protein FRC18_006596 [Serendipita sp. 400]KAG8846744.1 hypothetical protein FRB91_000499 [Serendipita sp. 411]
MIITITDNVTINRRTTTTVVVVVVVSHVVTTIINHDRTIRQRTAAAVHASRVARMATMVGDKKTTGIGRAAAALAAKGNENDRGRGTDPSISVLSFKGTEKTGRASYHDTNRRC